MSKGILLDPTGRPAKRSALKEALLARGLDLVVRELELAREHPEIVASRQYFEELVSADIPSADLTAVTATVETALWAPTLFSAIPAFDPRAGKVYLLRAWGVMTTTATPGNITITPRWGTTTGGVSLGASAATALTASVTAGPWCLEFVLAVRQVGTAASGSTMHGAGTFRMGAMQALFGGTTITTADTTTAQGIFIGNTFSAASQSITPKGVVLTSLN